MIELQITIAACALITSIVSIVLTIRTLKTQKAHNMKSVKPLGHITVVDHEDEIYVSIINKGIGPLIIESCKAKVRETFYDNLIDGIPAEIKKAFTWGEGISNLKGRALMQGERLYLLSLPFDEINKEISDLESLKKTLRDFLQHVTVILEYIDVYDVKYTQERLLDWFGRYHVDPISPKQIIRTK